ncbi:FAD-binding oxidoreductase [Bosea sp. (in: a-proteobacteria)]|uniref:FAD-binding oxidoreductase n=1 Tax=Bosea sp. (in: a-proteobacteria) TaxID=1871050 RepID=UPI003341475E
MSLPREALAALAAALGEDQIRVGAAVPVRNHADSAGLSPCAPAALLLPRSTAEVSAALAICHRFSLPVVVQGGLTGLAGGAHPIAGEIALSLERMNGIEDIDPVGRTMTVLAGTPLEAIQKRAAEAGLLYGVDLGARGSCTIGGNVATNAGGVQVLRYGMTRRNVLGLEAVLPDGRIVSSLVKLIKNNAGYDWTQLLIGSEGTLGVVTRVLLALQPAVPSLHTALCSVAGVPQALRVLDRLEARLPAGLLAFEAMWPDYLAAAEAHAGLAPPFAPGPALALLVEAALPAGEAYTDLFLAALAALAEEGLLEDVLVAQSSRERARFWAYREASSEFYRSLPAGLHFDISVPLAAMAEAADLLHDRIGKSASGATLILFGHIADGNLHLSIHPAEGAGFEGLAEVVFGIVQRVEGSISAEHGIGVLKRPYLGYSRSDAELALMRTLKQAIDPLGILNRGRILA